MIAAAPATDPVRPGDTIVLTVSKGQDLVEVPNVITGQTIAQAREQLEALGFTRDVERARRSSRAPSWHPCRARLPASS